MRNLLLLLHKYARDSVAYRYSLHGGSSISFRLLTRCLPAREMAWLGLTNTLILLARPARFELTTSAFGGQFPRFAGDCGGLRVGENPLVLRLFID